MQNSPHCLTASEGQSRAEAPTRTSDEEIRELLARQDAEVRAVLDDSAKLLGRKELRYRMEKLTGRTISIHMVNAWLAPGKEAARFPVIYIDAFCRATGNDALKRLILGPELSELLELGERAASILDERARRRVLEIRRDRTPAGKKRNGNGSCAL